MRGETLNLSNLMCHSDNGVQGSLNARGGFDTLLWMNYTGEGPLTNQSGPNSWHTFMVARINSNVTFT